MVFWVQPGDRVLFKLNPFTAHLKTIFSGLGVNLESQNAVNVDLLSIFLDDGD